MWGLISLKRRLIFSMCALIFSMYVKHDFLKIETDFVYARAYCPNFGAFSINAKADFNRKDVQSPRPLIVPISGPYVRSMYTYEPPLEGMPEANSDLEIAAGKTTEAARMKASQIPGPMISAAKVGVMKIPGSIAERDMITTPASPIVLVNVFLIRSGTFSSKEST